MATLRNDTVVRSADGQGTSAIVTATNIGTYGVAANSTYYVGTTQNVFNRASGAQTLTGVSIDGNAANITAYTINQNLGTANAPSFAGATLSSTLAINGGDGLRAFRAGAATVTSHIYWANVANTVAYNWQLDENNNAAMWGYTSAWGKLLTVTSAGVFTASGDFRAPIFYDSNDTAYYVDPNSVSRLSSLRVYSAFDTASSDVYANMRVINDTAFSDGMYIGYGNAGSGLTRIFGGGATTGALIKYSDYTAESNSFRAPIFYDSDNTVYYTNPSGTSNLVGLTVANTITGSISGNAATATNVAWSGITSKPTTLSGFGITDALPLSGGTLTGNLTITKASAYLYLNGTNSDSELRFMANGSDRWAVGMNVGDATENLNIYNYTTATTNFTILKASGNVGIGTTSPGYKLDITGDARIASAAGAGALYFGTTDPSNTYLKLDNSYDLTLAQNAASSYALYLAGAGNVYLSIDSNNNETDRAFIVQKDAIKAGTELFRVQENGVVTASSDFRAPIFYDSNNTAYYCDPASTSVLAVLQATRINFGADNAQPWTVGAGGTAGTGLTFGGDYTSSQAYKIFTAMENVGGNYSKLTLNWHTGIRIGAYYGYGGTRFYNNLVGEGTEIFSVGNLDSNVRVVNSLIVNGITINQERANNARMYGAGTGAFGLLGLDSAGSFRWQVYGESGNYGFLDSTWGAWDIKKVPNGELDLRVSSANVRVLNAGNYSGYSAFTASLTSTVDARAPIFYDSNDTTYYIDPASTSRVVALWVRGSSETTGNIYVGGTSAGNRLNINYDQIWTSTGHLYLQYSGAGNIDMNTGGGHAFSRTSLRAPIFYDFDNTAFYTDPASTSVLNKLTIDGGNYANNYFQSLSDFTSGTLVTTDIPATAAEGESFVMNVVGKSYSGSASPFNFSVQGYLYNSTIINYSGIKLDSTGLATIKIFENGGVLCFWWATVSYWNAFEVSVRGYNSARSNYNRVTNITNSTEPVGTKKVAVTLQSFLRADASATNSVDLRAPIFYDSNDTAYYTDPSSLSNILELKTNKNWYDSSATVWGGGINMGGNNPSIGFQNTGLTWWYMLHHSSDSINFYRRSTSGGWNQDCIWDNSGNFIWRVSSIRAPIFYDFNNTAYYLDPASGSSLNTLTMAGIITTVSSGTAINFSGQSDSIGYNATAGQGTYIKGTGTTYVYGGGTFFDGAVVRTLLHSNNYNSYAPTLTGTGASGSWGISVTGSSASCTGNSATVTINYNNDSNASYQMLWGSGNSVYGTAGVTLNPSTDYITAASFKASDWFRALGNTGLYFEDKGYGITSAGAAGNSYGNASTYGTGVNGWQGWGIGSRHCMMSTGGDNFGVHDNTRSWLYYWNGTYHNFQYGYLESASSVRGPLFYDSNDTTYYLDPANSGTSLLVAGKVGIGTTSPGAPLEVSGASGDGVPTFKITSTSAPSTFNYAGTMFNSSLGASKSYSLMIGKSAASKNSGYIGYNHSGTDGSNTNFLTFGHFQSDYLLNILGNGNVGIGTTSPSQKLHVVGTAYSDTDFRAPIFYDSNDTSYYVDPHSTSYQRSLFLGAHDSGASEFRFGEDSSGWYGDRWYWDSAYTLYRYSRYAGTDSLIHYHDTRDTSRITYGRNIVFDNYGKGIVGLYSASVFQLVFAMGDAYKTTAGGGISNLYGIAWSHPNAGGIAANLNTHGALIAENGTFLAAISGSIRCRDDMRAPIFYDSNNTAYYVDPSSTGYSAYFAGAIQATKIGIEDAGLDCYMEITDANPTVYGVGYGGEFIFYGDKSTPASFLYYGGATVTYTLQANSSLRSPIFYDSNDTGYYCDPASNSVLNGLYVNAYYNLSNDYKDIYVYGDVNTYYVVLIQGEYLYSFGRYSVTRGYNWTGPDTWYIATHKGGLTLDWEWSGDTAWGGNDKAIRIIEFNESYSTMVAGLGYPVNGGVIIWLRGGGVGGAQYRIRTPIGSNATVTVYDGVSATNHSASTSFTAANSAVFSTRADVSNVSGEILARYPVRSAASLYNDNNLVVDIGSGTQTKSGIFASAASVRAPIFYDTDNTGYYLDPASTSNLNNVAVAGTLSTNNIAKNSAGSPIVINSGLNASLGLRVYYDMNLYNTLVFTDSSWNSQGAISGSAGVISISAANATSNFTKRAGYSEEGGSFRAPIFYDSDNTAYYIDATSTSSVNIVGTNKIRADTNRNFGDDSGWWAHDPYGYGWGKPFGSFRCLEVSSSGNFSTEAAMFRIHQWGSGAAEFWKPQGTTLYLRETPGGGGSWFTRFYLEGYGETNGSWRAPIFYDSNDTAYYVNPNSETRLYKASIYAGNEASNTGANGSTEGLILRGNYNSNTWAKKFHNYDNGSGIQLYLAETVGTGAWSTLQGWGTGLGYTSRVFGSFAADSALYSPIFYDSNNTAYYTDPASTSNLLGLTVTNTITGSITGNAGGSSASCTGNAATATRTSGQSGYPHAGTGMWAFYNWGGNDGGTSAPSASTYTTGLSVGSNPGDQAYGFQIANNMWNTGLWTRNYNSSFGSWIRLLDSSNYVGYSAFTGNVDGTQFRDANDTGYYLDPAGTSNLNKFSTFTMSYNDMNPMSASSPYASRYGGSANYRNGTMGYGTTDCNHMFSNWGSGFIDSWSSPANAPGGSTHYVGLQGFHYNHQNNSQAYGFQMLYAGGSANRFFWRSAWPDLLGWVEMIHTGNYNSYAPTLTGTGASGTWSINVTGNASGTAGSISGFNNPVTSATANTIVYRDSGGDIYGRYLFGSYHNSSDDTGSTGLTYIMAKFGDNYHRSATADKVAAFISGQTMNINGSSTSCSGSAASAGALNTSNDYTVASLTSNGFVYSGSSAGSTGAFYFNSSSHGIRRASGTNDVYCYTTSGTLYLGAGGSSTTHIRVLSGGDVGIGISPSYKLDVNGSCHATCFPTSSDIRFKKKITPLENSLEKIKKLQGVKYEWNEFVNSVRDGYKLNIPIIGLIAQDVEKVIPEIIDFWKLSDDCQDARSIDYPRLIPFLIEAIKEQQIIIENQNQKIENLMTRMSALEAN